MATLYSPKIVTNGLVLYLDAGNRKSYPGSGTTWTDISGNGNTGTLTNGPTFGSGNGGNIVFDGVNDFLNLGQVFNYTTQSFSFSCWVYFNSLLTNQSGQGPVIFYKGRFEGNGYYTQVTTTGAVIFITNQTTPAFQLTATDTNIVDVNRWYNITFTRNSSSIRLYVDGTDRTLTTGSHINPTSSTQDFTVGLYNNTTDIFLIYANFKLANFIGYNRALTTAEVLQNYNATRSRFGL